MGVMATDDVLEPLVVHFLQQLSRFLSAENAASHFGANYSMKNVVEMIKAGTYDSSAIVKSYFQRLEGIDDHAYLRGHMIADVSAHYGWALSMRLRYGKNNRLTKRSPPVAECADFIATCSAHNNTDISDFIEWIDTVDAAAQRPNMFGADEHNVPEFCQRLTSLRKVTLGLIDARNQIRIALGYGAIIVAQRNGGGIVRSASADCTNG
jgi:hypothetical protein